MSPGKRKHFSKSSSLPSKRHAEEKVSRPYASASKFLEDVPQYRPIDLSGQLSEYTTSICANQPLCEGNSVLLNYVEDKGPRDNESQDILDMTMRNEKLNDTGNECLQQGPSSHGVYPRERLHTCEIHALTFKDTDEVNWPPFDLLLDWADSRYDFSWESLPSSTPIADSLWNQSPPSLPLSSNLEHQDPPLSSSSADAELAFIWDPVFVEDQSLAAWSSDSFPFLSDSIALPHPQPDQTLVRKDIVANATPFSDTMSGGSSWTSTCSRFEPSDSTRYRWSEGLSTDLETPAGLVIHLPIDATESVQAHPCPACSKKFVSQKDCMRHCRSLHPYLKGYNVRFPCPATGCKFGSKGFARLDKLKQHMATAHSTKPPTNKKSNPQGPSISISQEKEVLHLCDFPSCPRGEGFSTSYELDRHKRSVHHEYDNSDKACRWRCVSDSCKKRDKVWTRLDNFRKHVRDKHQSENLDTLIELSECWDSDAPQTWPAEDGVTALSSTVVFDSLAPQNRNAEKLAKDNLAFREDHMPRPTGAWKMTGGNELPGGTQQFDQAETSNPSETLSLCSRPYKFNV